MEKNSQETAHNSEIQNKRPKAVKDSENVETPCHRGIKQDKRGRITNKPIFGRNRETLPALLVEGPRRIPSLE